MSFDNNCMYIECLSADSIVANTISGTVISTIGNPSPPETWTELNYPTPPGDIVSTDTVADALWKTSYLTSLLIATIPVPPDLSGVLISMLNLYSAVQAVAPYTTFNNVDNDTLPQSTTTAPFKTGASGTLTAFIDLVNSGSKALVPNSNVGVYGALNIVSDTPGFS